MNPRIIEAGNLVACLVPFPEEGGIRVNPPSELHDVEGMFPVTAEDGKPAVVVVFNGPPVVEERKIV